MNARRVEVTFSPEEWDRLESDRGFESRASFVKRHYLRALESALGGAEESEHKSLDRSASAPSRASEREAKMDELAGPVVSPGVRGPKPKVPPIAGVDRASAFLAASQRKKS